MFVLKSHACYLWAVFILDFTGKTGAQVADYIYKGSNTETATIHSPEFTGSSATIRKAYTYLIENNETGYVRLVFSDFYLHYNNSLRLYDSISGSMYVYNNSTRPVIQSSASQIYMVYKLNNIGTNNIGWKVSVEYVQESRSQWSDIPATGLCPEISNLGLEMEILASDYGGTMPYVDCVWIGQTDHSESQYLAVVLPNLDSSVSLSVRHGNSSLASSIGASIYETNHTTYEIYHIPTNFYVRLTGKFTDGGLFRMAYHNSIETAKDLIDNIQVSMNNHRCAYKDCQALYGSTLYEESECRMYWEACNQHSYEPSCDMPGYVPCCDTYSEYSCDYMPCYNPKSDVCDAVNDCYNTYDETTCNDDETARFRFYRTVGYVFCGLGVMVFIIIVTRKRENKKRCQECTSNGLVACLDHCCACDGSCLCCKGLKHCWKACISSLLQCCSRIGTMFLTGWLEKFGIVLFVIVSIIAFAVICNNKQLRTRCRNNHPVCYKKMDNMCSHVEKVLRRIICHNEVTTESNNGDTNSVADTSIDAERNVTGISSDSQVSFCNLRSSNSMQIAIISDYSLPPPAYTEVALSRGDGRNTTVSSLPPPPAYSETATDEAPVELPSDGQPMSPPPAYEEVVAPTECTQSAPLQML